ncbi:MAG: DUF411 domain-containing protein [Burkholderiaceae bacterium]|jgi:hypothetical protein|nr:DUF411 domain-containing protein [Burkholderiaceae bacterium]
MKRRQLLSALLGAATVAVVPTLPALAAPALPTVEVFKSPYCGCCTAWVDHIKAAGFAVKVNMVDDTTAVRERLGMPHVYGSCHTATVDGYALEGHVPAAEVRRLLAQRPAAVGLAVPGMPASSPGMDVPGRNDPYEVLLIDKRGGRSVFARYPQS